MTKYAARRLAHGILLLLAVSMLTFLLSELAPGDFLAEMRLDPRISEETVEALGRATALTGRCRSATCAGCGRSITRKRPSWMRFAPCLPWMCPDTFKSNSRI